MTLFDVLLENKKKFTRQFESKMINIWLGTIQNRRPYSKFVSYMLNSKTSESVGFITMSIQKMS